MYKYGQVTEFGGKVIIIIIVMTTPHPTPKHELVIIIIIVIHPLGWITQLILKNRTSLEKVYFEVGNIGLPTFEVQKGRFILTLSNRTSLKKMYFEVGK